MREQKTFKWSLLCDICKVLSEKYVSQQFKRKKEVLKDHWRKGDKITRIKSQNKERKMNVEIDNSKMEKGKKEKHREAAKEWL